MSVPEPRENPRLFGHESAERTMLEALRLGRVHHAWLITGPFGVGKATLAYRFARRLLAGAGQGLAIEPSHPVFRRVAAGTHADLLTVERAWDEKRKRTRSEIVVDDVRTVSEFLRLTPAEDGWRVVVIDGAEHLNRNAANALLKVLEEPPPRAVLLLTCAAPGRLPPTIRSRCRRLRLGGLAPQQVEQLVADFLPDLEPQDRQRLAALADGSPGRAALLAEEQGVTLAGMVQDVLRAAPSLPTARALDVADRIGRNDAAFATFMDLLLEGLGTAVRADIRGHADAEQHRLVATRPLVDWADLWHALGTLRDETERFNLDKRHAIVSGLAMLNGS